MTPAVKAYADEIVNGSLADVLAKSKEVGGLVEQHVSLRPALPRLQHSARANG